MDVTIKEVAEDTVHNRSELRRVLSEDERFYLDVTLACCNSSGRDKEFILALLNEMPENALHFILGAAITSLGETLVEKYGHEERLQAS